jgi:hypothetical protein
MIRLPLWKKLKNYGSKSHNGWNRERDVKEKHNNFIQIIKGKLEETTPKRNNRNNIGNGGQGKI